MTRKRALLSVSDKSGIEEFARGLVRRGWEIVSTGGTARALANAGIPVVPVAAVTSHPEMMDGRVKTLHPAIHAGILARSGNQDDADALAAQGYAAVGLVAVNLYPFRETVAKGGGDGGGRDGAGGHRGTHHDPRRCEEPRRRVGGRGSGRLPARARGARRR